MTKKYLQLQFILLFLIITAITLPSKTIYVGVGGDYSKLSQAIEHTNPGDTLLLQGVFSGGDYIENFHGEPNKWIYIFFRMSKTQLFLQEETQLFNFLMFLICISKDYLLKPKKQME